MTYYANDVHPVPPDHGCGDCDDQLPLISRVGRGIAGDDARVRIAEPDSDCETHIEGGYWDNKDKTWHSEWISENVNGGKLEYQYNLRPYTIPRTFTITFIYRRPGRPQWSWTTPAIPYIWTVDQDGGKPGDDPDRIVGSGVATLFIRAGKDKPWREFLEYPEGTTREDFNAPEQGEAWTSNVTFGVGGDIEIPNLDDLAKVIGISVDQIKNIIKGDSVTINGIDARNLVEYIDKQDDAHLNSALDHVHKDLGFNSTGHDSKGAFGGEDTVKAYIDKKLKEIEDSVEGDLTSVRNTLADIVNKVYGGGTIGPDGHVTWNQAGKAAVGNINVLSSGRGNALLTHDGDAMGDLKGE